MVGIFLSWLARKEEPDFACAELAKPVKVYDAEKFGRKGGEDSKEVHWKARKELATLLHCSPSNLSLARNTSRAVEDLTVTMLLRHPIERILTTDEEYVSIYPHLVMQAADDFRIPYEAVPADLLIRAIRPRDLVIASHITHHSCRILPVENIVFRARDRGAWSIIDGSQSVGQIPVNLRTLKPDGYAGCGHKWLHSQPVGFSYIAEGGVAINDLYHFPTETSSDGPMPVTVGAASLAASIREITAYEWEDWFAHTAYFGEKVRDIVGRERCLSPRNPAPGMVSLRERPEEFYARYSDMFRMTLKKGVESPDNETAVRFSVSIPSISPMHLQRLRWAVDEFYS